jgi:hypothetical protein
MSRANITMNPTIQKRESSLELLRIIAMLLVLMWLIS